LGKGNVDRTSGALRTAMLSVGLIAALVTFAWWRTHSATGCAPFTRPGGIPAPAFDWWVAKATLPPAAMLVAGAWIALGARLVRWRFIGILIVAVGSVAGLVIGAMTFGVCTLTKARGRLPGRMPL
jgi:hypothetical protein